MTTISDPVYGTVEITEPVLTDLLDTAAVQRLRRVLQHGITGLIGVTNPTSRYDHSVGVMLLVRRMGASLDEQIAALLHDISHTAFSHVIDYVFNSHDSQGYHEDHKESYMAGSDLPPALARHGCDWRRFLHEEDYPLLEQPAPALCADRLDYFLRDARDLGLASDAEVQSALDSLTVHEGRIVCSSLAAARWMGYTYIAGDQASWANFREVGLYELAAQAIRRALQTGALAESDLWGGDAEAWAKLQASPDPEIRRWVVLVSLDTKFEWDETAPTFRVSTKLRTIDPDVLENGAARPLSSLDADFARYRESYLCSKAGKWPMRVIK